MDNKNKATRRPAGFGSATNRKPAQRTPEAPRPAVKAKQANKSPKRKVGDSEPKPERKPFPAKIVLIALALIGILLVVVLLGRQKTNIHALPTIVREETTASFAPDVTTTVAPDVTALFEDSVTPDPAALDGGNFEPEVTG